MIFESIGTFSVVLMLPDILLNIHLPQTWTTDIGLIIKRQLVCTLVLHWCFFFI